VLEAANRKGCSLSVEAVADFAFAVPFQVKLVQYAAAESVFRVTGGLLVVVPFGAIIIVTGVPEAKTSVITALSVQSCSALIS